MKKTLALVLGLVVVVVGLVLGEMWRGFGFSDRYSSYRAGREGTKALYLTFAGLGIRTGRISDDLESAGLRGALFVTVDAGAGLGIGPEESQELLGWVAEGNTLVLAHEGRLAMLDELGIEAGWADAPIPDKKKEKRDKNKDEKDRNEKDARDAPEEPSLADLLSWARRRRDEAARVAVVRGDTATLGAGAPSFLILNRPGSYRVGNGRHAVLYGSADAPAVIRLPHRRGQVVLVSDPWVFSNRGLMEPGNLDFALALAGLRGVGDVAFDERVHGFVTDRSTVGYLRKSGLVPALLQLVAVAVLAVLAWRGRRVPQKCYGVSAGPSSRDFLEAMGRIYAAAGFAGEAAREIGADLVKLAATSLRLPASCERERVLREVGARDRRLSGDLAALIQRAESGRLEGRGHEQALVGYHNQALSLAERLRGLGGGGRV